MADPKSQTKKPVKRIPISPELWTYLLQLSKTHLYGKGAAGTACFILKREINELITSGKFDALIARARTLGSPESEPDSDEEDGAEDDE